VQVLCVAAPRSKLSRACCSTVHTHLQRVEGLCEAVLLAELQDDLDHTAGAGEQTMKEQAHERGETAHGGVCAASDACVCVGGTTHALCRLNLQRHGCWLELEARGSRAAAVWGPAASPRLAPFALPSLLLLLLSW
jgi:hypothetical protein